MEQARSAIACQACRGLWLDEAVLDDMMRRMSGRVTAPTFAPREGPLGPPCPSCARHLAPVELEGVPVDRCVDRHGVWFDADELQSVLLGAGTPPAEPPSERSWGTGFLYALGWILDILA